MNNKMVLSLLFLSTGLALTVPATIVKRGNDYYAVDEEKASRIPTEFVSKELRNVPTLKLARMLNRGDGYLRLSPKHNGQYGIDLSVRGDGGAFITGEIAYWTTKAVCYGILAAGVTFGITTGVGAVAGAAGASAATATVASASAGAAASQVTAIAGTAATGLTALSAGASVGASAISAGVGAAGGGAVAAHATAATVASTGGGVGIFAAIETAAQAARYAGYVSTPW